MTAEIEFSLENMQSVSKCYLGPSFSSTMVDLLAEGLREACSMMSLSTITSGK